MSTMSTKNLLFRLLTLSLSLLLLCHPVSAEDDCTNTNGGGLTRRRRNLKRRSSRRLRGLVTVNNLPDGTPPDDLNNGNTSPCDGDAPPPGENGQGNEDKAPTIPLPGIGDPPSPTPAKGKGASSALEGECFSADATVQVLVRHQQQQQQPSSFGNGATIMMEPTAKSVVIPMSDLRVGDHVLTGPNNRYQPVYAFAHWQPRGHWNTFLQIHTTTTTTTITSFSPLEISKDHFLYLQGSSKPIRAASVQVGDVLQQQPGESSTNATAVVQSISTIQKEGLYAPLTRDGVLIVNGIKVSNYISLQQQQQKQAHHSHSSNHHYHDSVFVMAGGWVLPSSWLSQQDCIHYTLAPFRLVCNTANNKIMIVPEQIQQFICHSYDTNGYPHVIGKAIRAARTVDTTFSFPLQLLVLLLWIMTLVIPFVALEQLLRCYCDATTTTTTTTMVTIALVVTVAAAHALKRHHHHHQYHPWRSKSNSASSY